MNITFYFFAILTWFFSTMSLLTLVTGYHDPVMIVCAVAFALGAGAFGAMAKLAIEPIIKVVEVPPQHLIDTLDQPAYQRRGLDHDEQQ